ncbi:hypothetical protein [Methylobacterium oryzae]|uniref:hypothetical protein n=1 Tax=Methylobacterium oryzae TaxID=334852 RepID=UPI002F330905
MADRPILFSAPMVQALLREARQPGTGKTQTRRILKPEPATSRPREGSTLIHEGVDGSDFHRKVVAHFRPRFAVGDRLWVKETWQTGSGGLGPQIAYRATGDCHDIEAWDGEDEGAGPSFNYERCPGAKWHTWLPDLLSGAEGIWRPSLFMPRWASRLTLLLSEVRVERLHDISEADAEAEGCEFELWDQTLAVRDYSKPDGWFQAWSEDAGGTYVEADRIWRASFRSLWESINGPESWQANPWVVVVGFSVHARNIDQLAPIAEAAE